MERTSSTRQAEWPRRAPSALTEDCTRGCPPVMRNAHGRTAQHPRTMRPRIAAATPRLIPATTSADTEVHRPRPAQASPLVTSRWQTELRRLEARQFVHYSQHKHRPSATVPELRLCQKFFYLPRLYRFALGCIRRIKMPCIVEIVLDSRNHMTRQFPTPAPIIQMPLTRKQGQLLYWISHFRG